jgi:hypothetical protein
MQAHCSTPEAASTAPHPEAQPSLPPSPFRAECPQCGGVVVFPFDPVRSALLDALLDLREAIGALAEPAPWASQGQALDQIQGDEEVEP